MIGNREVILEWPSRGIGQGREYDVSLDGQRFLALVESGETDDASARHINVILHWHEELLERVPVP